MIIRVGLPENTGSLPVYCEKMGATKALISAGRLWNKDTQRFKSPGFAINDIDVALDSAGYSALKFHGGYQWRLEQYLELGCSYPWDWYASMDYCCEPDVSPIDAKGRMIFTFYQYAMSRKIIDKWREELPWCRYPVPVIQGWETRDYLEMIQWYDDWIFQGEWPDMVAVGSVCRRDSTNEIIDIVESILSNIPANVNLHLFGVKSRSLLFLNVDRIDSIDSCAWDISSRKKASKLGVPNTILMRSTEMQEWYQKQKAFLRRPRQMRLF